MPCSCGCGAAVVSVTRPRGLAVRDVAQVTITAYGLGYELAALNGALNWYLWWQDPSTKQWVLASQGPLGQPLTVTLIPKGLLGASTDGDNSNFISGSPWASAAYWPMVAFHFDTGQFTSYSPDITTLTPPPSHGPFASLSALQVENQRLIDAEHTGALTVDDYNVWYESIYKPEYARLTSGGAGPVPKPPTPAAIGTPKWVWYAGGAVAGGVLFGLAFHHAAKEGSRRVAGALDRL